MAGTGEELARGQRRSSRSSRLLEEKLHHLPAKALGQVSARADERKLLGPGAYLALVGQRSH